MNGKVLEGKILIKEIPNETVHGSIIIPNTALDKKQKNGLCKIGGNEVSSGDKVIYAPTGIKINVDGEEYVLLNEKDVLYIL